MCSKRMATDVNDLMGGMGDIFAKLGKLLRFSILLNHIYTKIHNIFYNIHNFIVYPCLI